MKYKIFFDKCVISHVFSFLSFLFSRKKRNQFYPHHIPFKIKNVSSSQIFDVFLSSKKEMKIMLVIRLLRKKSLHHLICFLFWDVRIWCNEWIYNISQYQDWSNLHPVMHFHKSLFAANLSLSLPLSFNP